MKIEIESNELLGDDPPIPKRQRSNNHEENKYI